MSLALNNISRLRNIFVVAMLVLALLASFIRPSYAATSGQISTRNIILGALAMTAGIVLYNNYQHKYTAAHTVVGYTRDGGTVYADGRIVYPDGTTLYTSNNGNTVCTFDGYGQQCQPGNVYGYYPNGNYPNNGSYPFSNPANPYGYYPNQTQTNCYNDPDDCQYATNPNAYNPNGYYPNGYSPNGYNGCTRTAQYPAGFYRANSRNHGRHLGWFKNQRNGCGPTINRGGDNDRDGD
jgi:hypothetical protein